MAKKPVLKFDQRKNQDRKTPEAQTASQSPVIKAPLLASSTFLSRLVLGLAFLVLVVTVGLIIAIPKIVNFLASLTSPTITSTGKEPPIVNPAGKGAYKYFPKGGDALDFRDGSNGPVKVTIERNGNQVIFNWDSTVKMGLVKIFDLGKVYKLDDDQLIWQIQNSDPKNPPVGTSSAQKRSFITPPYTLGTMPQGFFLTQESGQELKLTKGSRYSVELTGLNIKNLPTLGVYTFDY